MGARRLEELFGRYGRSSIEACFDAILDRTTQTYRREILDRIPVGSWVWEDYAEHDGVDAPKLHAQRITLTRTDTDDPDGERLVLDFAGTSPQAQAPSITAATTATASFLKKWLAPILRNLAETPQRMAELDVNEGVVPLIEMRSTTRHVADSCLPGADQRANIRDPAAARVLAGVLAKAVGGAMPADQETIRYTGVYGLDTNGRPYLMREVLGGGSGVGRTPTARTPSTCRPLTEPADGVHRGPVPLHRREVVAAVDSGGPGLHRGGLGYEKHIRMLRDAHFMSIADRSILACWGVNGGRAGRPFEVVVDPGGPAERVVDALADAEPVPAGFGDPSSAPPAAAGGAIRSAATLTSLYATSNGTRFRRKERCATTALW